MARTSTKEFTIVTLATWPSRQARDRETARRLRISRHSRLAEERVLDGGGVIGESFEIAIGVSQDE